ncbi:hypothetical protein TKK_0011232 [Trichogramma kaykai]
MKMTACGVATAYCRVRWTVYLSFIFVRVSFTRIESHTMPKRKRDPSEKLERLLKKVNKLQEKMAEISRETSPGEEDPSMSSSNENSANNGQTSELPPKPS